MGVVESSGDLTGDPHHARRGQTDVRTGLFLCPMQFLRAVGAGDVLHRDPQHAVVAAAVVDGDDVGMVQSGRDFGLAQESLAELFVGADLLAEDLDGIAAGKFGVFGQVDGAHAATTESALHPVPRYPGSRLQHDLP